MGSTGMPSSDPRWYCPCLVQPQESPSLKVPSGISQASYSARGGPPADAAWGVRRDRQAGAGPLGQVFLVTVLLGLWCSPGLWTLVARACQPRCPQKPQDTFLSGQRAHSLHSGSSSRQEGVRSLQMLPTAPQHCWGDSISSHCPSQEEKEELEPPLDGLWDMLDSCLAMPSVLP